MGFIDPKRDQDDDQDLPGAGGLHLDLDLKRCPSCRREVAPWQSTCPDCGDEVVDATAVPAADFPLAALALDVDDDPDDGDGPDGAAERDATPEA